MTTINRTELGSPNLDLIKHDKAEKLLRKENLSNLLHNARDISSSFTSGLPSHDASHERRHFETTYGAHYGSPCKPPASKVVDTFAMSCAFAAGKERAERQMPRNHVLLAGEILRKSEDPKADTEAQRTWTGKRDAGVLAAQRKKAKDMLAFDNALSLPLGDGERAKMLILEKPGVHNKRKTDITAKLGKKVITKNK